MIVDTHCHLDFPEFAGDLDNVLNRAKEAGVVSIINVASSIKNCRSGALLSEKYDQVYFTAGIHPHHADEFMPKDISIIEEVISKYPKAVAIGEVGLDFYKNFSKRENQIMLFESMLDLKKRLGLPIIIHSRESFKETIDIMTRALGQDISGVMHCYAGGRENLKSVLDLGMYVSFTCNVTYKKAESIREAVKYAPLDRLLIETDAPFLSPQDMRGKRNEPANLSYLVKEIAAITGLDTDNVEKITTENAARLFGVKV